MTDQPPYPGTPRWVKVSVVIIIVLLLLVAFAIVTGLGGPHGPGRHLTPGAAHGDTAAVRLQRRHECLLSERERNAGYFASAMVIELATTGS